MPLSFADLQQLSLLLDEALDLPAGAREAWLTALPAEHRQHAAVLRAMLAKRDSTRGGVFLASGPRLEGGPSGVDAVACSGEVVGAYRLVREIGRGGMGSVWLAERADGAFDRQVALKLPRLSWADGLAERMARERHIGALLEHPHIARLYDAGVDDKARPYIAMELIDGVAIDTYVADHRLEVPDTLELMLQVIRAVAYAHARQVVHCDLKPSNVLVTADRTVHLLDFGIATLDHPDTPPVAPEAGPIGQGVALTPAYASPEQRRGEAATVQSDVYGLGVMLFELLTGQLPRSAQRDGRARAVPEPDVDPAELASRTVKDPARARALRGDIDAILGRAMKSAARDRYSSATALAEDIERHMRAIPVRARPDGVLYRLQTAMRRHQRGVLAATLVGLTVAGAAAVSLVHSYRAAEAAARQKLLLDYVTDVFHLEPGTAAAARSTAGDAFLRESARLVSKRFENEPAMQARLYMVIAERLLDMGAADEGADYAGKAVESLQTRSNDQEALTDALLLWSQALNERGRRNQAIEQVRRALSLAVADPVRSVRALSRLARLLSADRPDPELGKVLEKLEEAAKLIRGSIVDVAWAPFIRGELLVYERRMPEAQAQMESAIELARTLGGPHDLALAVMHRQLGWHLMQSGNSESAQRHLTASHNVFRHRGGASAVKGALAHVTDWVWLLISKRISYREALEAIDLAQAAVNRFNAVPDRLRTRLDLERGIAATVWGDIDEARRWLPAAAERVLATSDWPSTRIQAAQVTASVLTIRGEHAAAQHWIDEISRARQAMMGGADSFAIWDPIVRAINLSMWGRNSEAQAILDPLSIPQNLPNGMPASTSGSDELRVARARVMADAGRYGTAWSLLHEPTLADVSDVGTGVVSSSALRAELLCRSGRPTEGLIIYEAEISAALVDRFEGHPKVAWLRGHAGLCALAGGNPAKARAFAHSARASFDAHPIASEYYKAPLFRLEALLGRQASRR